MAKISAYPNGNPPVDSDEFIVGRAGDNRKLTWANVKAAISALYVSVTNADWLVLIGGGATTLHTHAGGGGDKYPMEARLTLETGVAVSTTDQADKATLYLTPYKGCQIATYDGVSAWSVIELTADLSLDISGYTASKPYDIWVYDNGGTLTLDSTIWTNGTTRATALALQNGVYVKTGATTRRYIGTIYMDAASKCQDTVLKRYVWNYYNRTLKRFRIIESTDNWNYPANIVWRQWANNSANKAEFVIGVSENTVQLTFLGLGSNGASTVVFYNGIGLDATNAIAADSLSFQAKAPGNINGNSSTIYVGFPGIGYHYLALLEYAGTNTDFYGDAGVPLLMQLGGTGWLLG
jgi:hypothetical protein